MKNDILARCICVLVFLVNGTLLPSAIQVKEEEKKRPNILLAISDDQFWPNASAYGTKGIETPHFERLAKEWLLFRNAFVAAILTGKNIWQLEEAGTHASYFSRK